MKTIQDVLEWLQKSEDEGIYKVGTQNVKRHLESVLNEQLRQCTVSVRREQCNHKFERVEKGGEFQGNQCDCGEWEDLT